MYIMNDSKSIYPPTTSKAAPFGKGLPLYNNILKPIIGQPYNAAEVSSIQGRSIYTNFPLTYPLTSFRVPAGASAQVF